MLNAETRPDSFPVPYLQDFSNFLHGMSVFAVIDLRRAYYHVPVAEEHVEKNTVMPFGLRNDAQTMQRFIDMTVCDLPFAFAYFDDILVDDDYLKHAANLNTLFQRLS